MIKRQKISIVNQYLLILAKYKNIVISNTLRCNKAKIILRINPSIICRDYEIKIEFTDRTTPKIYIIKPSLLLENTNKRPPHIYSLEEGRICVCLPNEITIYDKFTTIIPWISEWLIHYEIWRCSGKWCGKGHNFEK